MRTVVKKKKNRGLNAEQIAELRARNLRRIKARAVRVVAAVKEIRPQKIGAHGDKERLMIGVFLAGLVALAAAKIFGAETALFYIWAALGALAVLNMYVLEETRNWYDIALFIPLRLFVAAALVGGFVFLAGRAINDFWSHPLSALSLGKNGLVVFGYLIVAVILYRGVFRAVSLISIRVFKKRPYYERRLSGPRQSEYFFKKSQLGLAVDFAEHGVRGLFIYPNEPLFLPALRAIKKKIGPGIFAISLTELAELVDHEDYRGYFELISFIRPEIKNPRLYWQMFPFVLVISDESVREFDLGAARTEEEINQLIAEINREQDLRSVLLASAPKKTLRWYDRPLNTLITRRAVIFLPALALVALFFLGVTKLTWSVSLLCAGTLIVYADAAFALWHLYRQVKLPPHVEETVEK